MLNEWTTPRKSSLARKADELTEFGDMVNQHLGEDRSRQGVTAPVTIAIKQGHTMYRATVPAKTTERDREQLLVNRFGENARKGWRVVMWDLNQRRQEYLKLGRDWSYEMADREKPEAPQNQAR
jgi:hypothetical protein